jgi:hypothetical protein
MIASRHIQKAKEIPAEETNCLNRPESRDRTDMISILPPKVCQFPNMERSFLSLTIAIFSFL